MASPTQWMWVWVNSGRWWWTGRPDVLWFMGSQCVGHDWATELNWTELMLNLPGIVLNILYLFWIFTTAYNIVYILTLSLSNSPKKHRNIKRTKQKICKIKQKLSCFRTAEEEVENKAWKPLLKPFHLLGMFYNCGYLCKLLFLCPYPRFPWMLPPND